MRKVMNYAMVLTSAAAGLVAVNASVSNVNAEELPVEVVTQQEVVSAEQSYANAQKKVNSAEEILADAQNGVIEAEEAVNYVDGDGAEERKQVAESELEQAYEDYTDATRELHEGNTALETEYVAYLMPSTSL